MRKYTHLSSKERVLISHYHDNGISVSEIGRLIGRPKSTVSRELSRNSNQRSYTPKTAKKRYLVRRQKGGIENMNGRFRRDLPRKTDILNMREEELEQIIISHNMAPRKILKGISPLEALAKHQGRNIIFLFNTGVALHM